MGGKNLLKKYMEGGEGHDGDSLIYMENLRGPEFLRGARAKRSRSEVFAEKR